MPDSIPPVSNISANRQIARAAGTVMAAFIFSQLTGLLRTILVANAFGTNPGLEAFASANRVSETIFNLVAGGALASAFIPTFTSLLTRDEHEEAWRLASAVANLILLLLTALSALAAIFAPQVVRYLLAPGFVSDPLKFNLTVDLMRLMLPSAVIFGLSGLVMGILNSRQVFLIPALTPSMYNLGIIFGVQVLAPGSGIYGLAWGVLIGASLHLLLQVPILLRQKGRYFPALGLQLASVREVVRLMGPRLIGVAVVQLNFWVNVRLASEMPDGSVNGVVYAFTLMYMPLAVIAQSIAIAAMPTFSAQVARGRLDEMQSSLAASLRGVLLLAVPASIGLMLLRQPLVVLLYQRGEFDAYSTGLVAWALLWYAAGLVGHSLVEILSRAFYALHDTRTPVFVGAVAMGLNVIFSLLFASLFRQVGWLPHGGLALANSLATALETLGLLYLMRRRLNGLQGRQILAGLGQSGLAGLLMAGGVWFWLAQTGGYSAWLIAGGGVAIGGLLYGLLVLVLRVPEVNAVTRAVKRRLAR
jgi:putative peptidoglycan lipid II flippase